ncbi:MAG: polymerase subunit epsilon, partial [Glaciihabitans sp.]|nr:polymerase subunit epsilon [Glaciihabitans sp.]
MARGFAVIDFETTGLLPSYQHRVVEVAVVHVDPVGRITGVWDTLVNPRRDLGPQRIHGVRAIDAMRAPTFDLIAPELLRLLEGRVIVAHNANFDVRFLTAELHRLELWLPPFDDITLCTMQLARTFLPGAGRSLADCAAAVGIDLANAHRASADALATAQLLSAYLSLDPEDSLWQLPLDRAGHVQWPSLMPTNVGWMSRPDSPEKQMPFLERITEKIAEFAGASEQLDYLALLDRCLVDRVVSSHEADA